MLVVLRLLTKAREIYQELHFYDLFDEGCFYFIKLQSRSSSDTDIIYRMTTK